MAWIHSNEWMPPMRSYPQSPEENVRLLSLCAGIGTIDLGIRIADRRARTIAYVEREAYAAAILAARMADGSLAWAPIWSDLATFEGDPWRGAVDTVLAGFPCQPFSVAGKRRGLDDERNLWPHILRIVEEVRPAALFCENSPNLLRTGFSDVLTDLAVRGWNAEWGVFSASASGAPHLRKRLFFLALHSDADRPRCRFIAPAHNEEYEESQRHHADRLDPSATSADPEDKGLEIGQEPEAESGALLGSERRGWWSTEPRIQRVVDGYPSRVERVRTVGAAVVPAVAARAWSTLWNRFRIYP